MIECWDLFLILLRFILQNNLFGQDISHLFFTVEQDHQSFIISVKLSLEANEMFQDFSGVSRVLVL